MKIEKFIILIVAGFMMIYAFDSFYNQWETSPQTTGVCIFKGPASYGLFYNSDGVPLRGINVTLWKNPVVSPIEWGYTDRSGCFEFQGYTKDTYYLTYNYNNQTYFDQVQGGTILRDNVP